MATRYFDEECNARVAAYDSYKPIDRECCYFIADTTDDDTGTDDEINEFSDPMLILERKQLNH